MEPVLEILRQKGHHYTVSGQDYLIKCLNPDHEDSNPSMRVDKSTGIFNCFSCGFKGNLFKYYGLLSNNVSVRVAKLKRKIQDIRTSMIGLDPVLGAIPYTHTFRGISKQTLKYFGAFSTSTEEKLLDRIVFPIKDITGKTVVYVARHTLSDGNPRYVNFPAASTMPLYPAVFPNRPTNMVIVEGLFDMLNLYDKGLTNVACAFGTQTLLSDIKGKMIGYKAQGIKKVYIMFDGDDAGRSAANKLKPLLEAEEYEVEIIKLEDDTDPGDMSQEYVDSIREYVNAG